MWQKLALLSVAAGFSPIFLAGQSNLPTSSIAQAKLEHQLTGLSVEAKEARPLRQATVAIREEYGWLVDYEDPIYQGNDLVDDTNPSWRATHPGAKGVTKPAGGEFKCMIPALDAQTSTSGASQSQAFNQLVTAYNSSGKPGHFVVIDESKARLSIVGVNAIERQGLFGILINLPKQRRSADETLAAIFTQVSVRAGKQVALGFASMSILAKSQVEVGGENVPARQLLADTLDQTKRLLVWEALYEADTNTYFINIVPAVRTYYGASGDRIQELKRSR